MYDGALSIEKADSVRRETGYPFRAVNLQQPRSVSDVRHRAARSARIKCCKSAIGHLCDGGGTTTVTLYENVFAKVQLSRNQIPPCFKDRSFDRAADFSIARSKTLAQG